VRYIEAALLLGAKERARVEAEFALERNPESRELVRLARKLGMDVPEPPVREPAPAPAPAPAPVASRPAEAHPTKTKAAERDREELMRSAFGAAQLRQDAALPSQSSQPSWRDAAPSAPAPTPQPAESEAAPVAKSSSWSDPWTSDSSDPQAVTLGDSDGEEPAADDADSQAVEANAARYLAKKDPRGGDAALEAARRYIADGRNDAASDLLLQLISSGVADHDAQRLLVDVVRTLGKRDVAKAKCQLLVQALRLDGREDLAAEVEQLALAD
jgi:hypothetical protein